MRNLKLDSSGGTGLEDVEDGDRLSKLGNYRLKSIIETNPCETSREVAEELNLVHSGAVRHPKKIGKIKKLDKWIPHELTENQKLRRFEISSKHIQRNNDHFLNRIITYDQKGILYDNHRRSAECLVHDQAQQQHFA